MKLLLVFFMGIAMFFTQASVTNKSISKNNTENIKADYKNYSSKNSNQYTVKNGTYNKVLTDEDISMEDQDIYLEIDDKNITIVDGFAMLSQQGTFTIEGNKLIGQYNKIAYLDHTNGGNITEKSINEALEFEILEDGSLKDLKGFGRTLDKTLFKGEVYKLK